MIINQGVYVDHSLAQITLFKRTNEWLGEELAQMTKSLTSCTAYCIYLYIIYLQSGYKSTRAVFSS